MRCFFFINFKMSNNIIHDAGIEIIVSDQYDNALSQIKIKNSLYIKSIPFKEFISTLEDLKIKYKEQEKLKNQTNNIINLPTYESNTKNSRKRSRQSSSKTVRNKKVGNNKSK